jgi:photosystem II stability/assembly factor-like uncharacterized protein
MQKRIICQFIFVQKKIKNMKNYIHRIFLFLGLIVCGSSYGQWTAQSSGFLTPDRKVVDLFAINPNIVWAVAKDNGGSSPCRDFTKTINGGTNWLTGTINSAPTSYDFSNITAIDENVAWVAMHNTIGSGGGVYKTTDGGANWFQQGGGVIFTGATSLPNSVYFWNANNGVVLGNPSAGYFEIYTTNNGGTTWTRVPSINIPTPQAGEVGTNDKFCFYGATIWFTSSAGRVFKSTNAGLNWTVSTPLAAVLAQDIVFKDANNGFVTYVNGTLYKTTNGGTSWSQISTTGLYLNDNLESIPFSSTLVSFGLTGSSYSNDNGSNWTTIDNTPHHSMVWFNAITAWSGAVNTSSTVNGVRKYAGTNITNIIQGMSSQLIGRSSYQLQSNGSVGGRFIKNSDGSMIATWNLSFAASPPYSDKGTGYNYYNGAFWGSFPSSRIEPFTADAPSVVATAAGGEVIASVQQNSITTNYRSPKGFGPWSEIDTYVADYWPRTVIGGANGNTVHMIAHAGGASNAIYMGQTSPITYSRSTNEGYSWDLSRIIIPQIGVSSYRGFDGDSYAIDARGNTVAIVIGGHLHDVILLKSIDNGTTWTKTIVKQFPIFYYDPANMNTDLNSDGVGDPIESCDRSVSVLIDNSNVVHVWYGKAIVSQNPLTTNYSVSPTSDGIMYWKESMPPDSPVKIANYKEVNGDGVLATTTSGNYGVGVSSQPSSAIDASTGHLYLAYSSLYDGNTQSGNPITGKRFRHTFLTKSTDGGLTWCPPLDIVAPEGYSGVYDNIEGVYGMLSKNADGGFAHLILQKDSSPGHGIDVPVDTQQDPLADILYYKIPTSSICSNNTISTILATTTVTDVSCYGGNNGQISVSVLGGTPPYSFSWNTTPVQMGSTANGLAAGSYICTITDNAGQSFTAIATVTQPQAPLSVTVSKTDANCGTADGNLLATVSGGTIPYTYVWSNGFSAGNMVTNLATGTYSVMVTDSKGCVVTSVPTTIEIIPADYNLAFSASPQTGSAPLATGFNNATPNMSNYDFTWFYGDGATANDNNTTSFYTYNFSGLYDVTLLATSTLNGCKDTLIRTGYILATGTGCSHTAAINQSGPILICDGDSVLLVASTNAIPPYSFIWNINGTVISGATNDSIYVTSSGYYSVTVLKNGCPKTSTATQVVVNSLPPSPQISAVGSIQTCIGGAVTLNASSIPGVIYLWNNSQSTQSITVTTPGTYFVTVINSISGCSNLSNSLTINNTTPYIPVCLVTVDSLSTHNIVVWEKPVSDQIDSFLIYREVTTNVFQQIGSVSYDSLSEYHDYLANPNTTAYSYKIAALDTCGGVGALSDFHKTIHLQNLGNGNLQWTLYDIENTINPVVFYRVYRDDLGIGNFLPISITIPGGNTTYTDVNFGSYPNAKYRVDVSWAYSCTSTRATINTTRSNIKSSGLITVILEEINSKFVLYPNPATNSITLKSLLGNERMSLIIYNAIGQIVYSKGHVIGSELISTENFPRGVYTMTIQTEKGLAYKRIVLQ